MELLLNGFPIFLLIFCRITAFFVVAPIFSTNSVPATFKVGLGFFVSVLVFLVYGVKQSIVPDATYLLEVAKEIMVGLLLGYVVYLFFSVVHYAGAFIDMQVGFSMVNVIDPLSGVSSPLTGNLKYMLLALVFLSMNGHHYLLKALMESYQWIPLQSELFAAVGNGTVSGILIRFFSQSFLLALQLSAPIMVAMFLTDVGLGFLARTAPQYNVFVIGAPLKILVGMIMLILLMPTLGLLFDKLFSVLFHALDELVVSIQPSRAGGP
ncbi:flagellar biosynthetic protein FliR [Paenibacillus beijingensis]|uniref:Flagellar biosynthetic protein FliR n=1 Tax=Paenibacillus beijingensis TaxID=1126833 RepID=A0A0D5NNI9_9BACL|nr:flagellar biosynthetic protein FliR [Paenibacillus beijingensis]AJY76582.1 flagellar biosynthesis protein FliR [Paenibacillus beijingensis]